MHILSITKSSTVNVLGAQHQHISNVFASKMTSEERFKHGVWTELETGAPVLKGCFGQF